MARYSKELFARTIQLCQPYCDVPLLEEEAREILNNLAALLLYLRELEQKYGQEENIQPQAH